MAFFNNEIISESYSYLPATEGTLGFQGTASEAEDIFNNFVTESFAIDAGIYAADSMLEHAVFEGYSDPESLLENALTDMIDKVKAAISGLWKKISAWITKTKDNLKLMVSVNTKFIYKNEKNILKKVEANGKDLTYWGYSFKGADEVTKTITDLMGTNFTPELITKITERVGTDPSETDIIADITKGAGLSGTLDSVSAVAIELTKKFNGSEQAEEFKGVNASDISKWMGEIKAAKKTLQGIRVAEEGAKKQINEALKSLDKAKAAAKKAENKDEVKNINNTIKIAKFASKFVTKLSTTLINCQVRMYKQYGQVCKQANAISDKKDEKVEDNKPAQESSLFSSAMNYFN